MGDQKPGVNFYSLHFASVEASPVSVIEEDGLPCVATQGNMIERSRTVNSWLTGHGSMLNNKLQLCKPDPIRRPHKDLIFPQALKEDPTRSSRWKLGSFSTELGESTLKIS